jgi:hypothetical protein
MGCCLKWCGGHLNREESSVYVRWSGLMMLIHLIWNKQFVFWVSRVWRWPHSPYCRLPVCVFVFVAVSILKMEVILSSENIVSASTLSCHNPDWQNIKCSLFSAVFRHCSHRPPRLTEATNCSSVFDLLTYLIEAFRTIQTELSHRFVTTPKPPDVYRIVYNV